MKITYNGHACFSITSDSYTILLDPYSPGSVPGYGSLDETANQVLCSHEHGDHNARDAIRITGSAKSPFEISTISTWHDDAQGKLRGPNTIHILKAEGLTVVHLGDLGCALQEAQLARIRHCDVLLIPVGGHYTIDATAAADIARQVGAKITIPMHYSGPGFGYDVIRPVSEFLRLFSDVEELDGPSIELPAQQPHSIVTLHAKYRTK
ncbi:MAG: MBL fold metallo-hydrolase [Clostridia bacterium]|nr:MBL fold metallo-hydrolase [Clostridia bacterium]